MPSRLTLRFAEYALVMVLALVIFMSWREDRRDRSQLAAQLAAAQQSLNEASARQHDRDAQLDKSLADLAAQKRSVITPAEILAALPKEIPLPAPITLQADHTSSPDTSAVAPHATAPPAAKTAGPPSASASVPGSGVSSVEATLGSPSGNTGDGSQSSVHGTRAAPDGAVIPREDLKPLYDFALDCKACQAKLAASQSDLQDEKAKTATLTKERDEAVRAAKGGSAWRRVTRAAKWFLLGAAAGIVAAKAHH